MPTRKLPAQSPPSLPPGITLSPEQRRIVKTQKPYVEVIAVPGSGKTFTLAQRALHLAVLASGQVSKPDARRVLVLSFSNDSVGVVKKALAKIGLQDATVSTGHAFALKLVKDAQRSSAPSSGKASGLSKAPGPLDVLTDGKALSLLRHAVSELRHGRTKELKKLRQRKRPNSAAINQLVEQRAWLRDLSDSSTDLHVLLNLFAFCRASQTPLKQMLSGSSDAKPAQSVSQFRGHYELVREVRRTFKAQKKKDGVIDFGDMVRDALPILANSAKSSMATKFDHLLVDEYQDSSPQQVQFIAALAAIIPSVMVAGDPKQAIFGFAGGGYTPLSSVLNGVKQMPLTGSRRLHSGTANFASALFDANSKNERGAGGGGAHQPIGTLRAGPEPEIVISQEFDDQISELASRIKKLIAKGVLPTQIAVLCRIRAILTAVQMKLHRHGISVRHLGQRKEYVHIRRVLKTVRFCEQHEQAASKPDRKEVKALAKKLGLTPPDTAVGHAVRELRRASSMVLGIRLNSFG